MRSAVAVGKMILLYLALAVTLFLLLNTLGLDLMQRKLVKEKEEDLYSEANLLLEEYIGGYYTDNLNREETAERLSIVAGVTNTRIWLTGISGDIILDTKMVGGATGKNILKVDPAFFEYTFLSDVAYEGFTEGKTLFVNLAFYRDYVKRGYITISVSMESIYNEGVYYSDFVNICLLLFLPVLLGVFAIIYCTNIIPVNRMGEATLNFAKGDFKEPLELTYPIEFGGLGSAIIYMGDKLKNFKEVQRRFLSNVSHDFKSPLTSIKGYVEAIKDGTIPKEDEEKYLDIIIFETERLQKLTTNILELNNFDDNGVVLHKAEFDINKMIKQIALAFEGTFKKKKLVMSLVFSQKEQFVVGDPDKIQQVLYNLIDNAVKFSNVDSVVRVRTEEKGAKVVVYVKDYGIGIPKESINKIWDRFYKTDMSRGRDKKGSGLGLSIVKEIVTAHGENISVVSTPGAGSEFVFTLPLAK
ncbi:MAG: two-component sensor histidine kinase [Lachnospiraceae bacterium]|nr:two-component sensor histidine kinase [Lachnospiraceae bacterium]